MEAKTAQPGSVSHGTLRTEDLIPRFLDVLKELDPDRHEAESYAYGHDVACGLASVEENDANMLESLFDVLNEYAPVGHYFGAHPGDGSDFGFWPCDDAYGSDELGGEG